MKYIVDTNKTVEQASQDLQAAVKNNKFGVLHIYNLKETLKSKGIDFENECQILEICNPQQANKVMCEEMDMNMALPCRISVYSENGVNKIGMIKPLDMLKMLSTSPVITEIAEEVEATMVKMINEAR